MKTLPPYSNMFSFLVWKCWLMLKMCYWYFSLVFCCYLIESLTDLISFTENKLVPTTPLTNSVPFLLKDHFRSLTISLLYCWCSVIVYHLLNIFFKIHIVFQIHHTFPFLLSRLLVIIFIWNLQKRFYSSKSMGPTPISSSSIIIIMPLLHH